MSRGRFVYWTATASYSVVIFALLLQTGYAGLALATPTIPAAIELTYQWARGVRMQRQLKAWLRDG